MPPSSSPVGVEVLFLPYMACLHHIAKGVSTTGPPPSIPVGLGVGDGSAVASPDTLRTSWGLERQLGLDRLPRTLFSSIISRLVGPESGLSVEELSGGLVHLCSSSALSGTPNA